MKYTKYLCSLVPADLSVCDEASGFLQSGFWGSFKSRFGWKAKAFLAGWLTPGGPVNLPLLVICRPLGPGLSFAYVPWGPELPPDFSGGRQSALEELARVLKNFLPKNLTFIRFDPPWYSTETSDSAGASPAGGFAVSGVGFAGTETPGRPFRRAAADIQPPDSVILALAMPEEAIMEQMKNKWRYNIRLAEKKGVSVRRAGGEALPVFYELFGKTAKRDGIAIHSMDYYAALFALSGDYSARQLPAEQLPDVRLYLAEHEGEALAGIVTLFRGSEAVYLYGASSDHKRNLMAPYALQWRAIRDAKAAGCLRYDLFGIPPTDDPQHPMAGLYRFKTGFGGSIIHRSGSWDYAYRPFSSALFRWAEALRKKKRDKKKKRQD